MSQLPAPLRAALGLVATAVDRIRTLPQDAPELPVHLVGNAMQLSLRAQQRYVELTNRGDELLSQMRGAPEEPPTWATFDEDASAGPSSSQPTPANPAPPPAATPAPAARKAAAKKAPAARAPATKAASKKVTATKVTAKKATATKATAKKAPAKNAAANKAAGSRSAPRPVAKKAARPAPGAPAVAPHAGSNGQAKSVFDLTPDPGDTPT
ncbi:MAG: hypothetical protein ACR2KJ_19000 [Jatrophihabitans sp.]